ncbi:MAG TPA: type II toxin-antitoxin system RelE/ParE family toxin [Candidatus Kapabacteria bacterium]|nr:type II toxin-antitoxin system RelE/ParE family toxin [Candidatus Kapabacteria bacterium]
MRYIFHPEALQEYEEAVLYYSEISKDLAVAFIKCIENGIKKIREYPDAWQIVEEDIRRHLIKRFPFGIYYSIEREYIMIISVMHMNRKPGYWISRIR